MVKYQYLEIHQGKDETIRKIGH